MKFRNRAEAGKRLAMELSEFADRDDVIVLALPRGGVPVAFAVAQVLRAPLDVFLVRKLGVPGQDELAMGAIASGGVRVLNDDVVQYLKISDDLIKAVARREQRELERREKAYRGSRPPVEVEGKTVILVDDGLATGTTMRAAVTALQPQRPARLVVAVPVASAQACAMLQGKVSNLDCICLYRPESFWAVGAWYENFSQTTDEEVTRLLSLTPQNESLQTDALTQPAHC